MYKSDQLKLVPNKKKHLCLTSNTKYSNKAWAKKQKQNLLYIPLPPPKHYLFFLSHIWNLNAVYEKNVSKGHKGAGAVTTSRKLDEKNG